MVMTEEVMKQKYLELGITEEVYNYGTEIEKTLKERFAKIDEIAEYNQLKVINAMQKCRVSAECFQSTSGYGYNDIGRDTLEEVYAECFHGEAALVRPQITCGTHALALALMSNLRPGDELLSPVGKPYDTLEEVIGIRPSKGSLAEYGITYRQVNLLNNRDFDFEGIRAAINEKTKLVTIQRSKGYQTRPSFSVSQIGELIAFVKSIKPDVICMVDNCYGEFIEKTEPSSAGADIIVGSLIKNPGGGLAPCGGYIAGRADLIEKVGYRLTAPSLGTEVGSYEAGYRPFYQGLFMAPHVTAQAVKGMLLFSESMKSVGFATLPDKSDPIGDIICSVRFDTKEQLIAFCQGIQYVSPVDSFAVPEPWDMPGYLHQVIMAAGCFVGGSSIELSCDSPIKEPYIAYLQGGLTYEHVRIAVKECLNRLKRL